MFELHITNVDATSGAIPITWCLDKESLATFKKTNGKVIIIVAPEENYHRSKELRFVSDVTDGMAYISFKYPGKNKIFGFIVGDPNNNMRRIALEHVWDQYTCTMLCYDGHELIVDNLNSLEYLARNFESAKEHISVDVPRECFAPEPSALEQAWVNWLFDVRVPDQCAFRRRRIFAYTVQPFIMLINYSFRMLYFTIAALLGMRGTSFKPMIHPLNFSLTSVIKQFFSGGTIFIRPEPEQFVDESPVTPKETVHYLASRFWSLPFMPPLFTLLCVITMHHWWHVIIFCLIAGGAFAITAANLPTVLRPLTRVCELMLKAMGPTDVELEETLVCTGQPKPLPKARTIKLRYLDLKSKICKPYAR